MKPQRGASLPSTISRRLLWLYALLLLIAAFGYARYDTYIMDGDGTAFLDIAQALNTHHAALAVNGYWNPGYPAILALTQRLTRPSLWRELAWVRYANVLVVALAMATCIFFTSGLARARLLWRDYSQSTVSAPALHLLGLALLLLSLERELPVAAPRSDTLLFALLLFAAGLLLRILTGPQRLLHFGTLGLTLGLAYLTKSFAFLPSVALLAGLILYSLRQPAVSRRRIVTGAALAAFLFALTAGPYILAISHQLGHLTTGDSARLNYAFFIDLTPRWHEYFHHDLGHATGIFLHPEPPLVTQPPVFSYAAHPVGTFPLWFDPAWWTLGLKPHIWLHGHILRLLRNIVVFVRYLLGRPEPFVLLAVLVAFGAAWPSLHRPSRLPPAWFLAPVAWGLLMLGIYFPIDLQDRYLTAPLFLTLLPLFAVLRTQTPTEAAHPPAIEITSSPPTIPDALIVLFAALILAQSATYLADRRRHTPPAERAHPGFDPQIFTAAAALDQLGLQPADKVACMGDQACYTDFYWARLAGTQILAEVETPGEGDPITVWNSIPDRSSVTSPLRHMGLRYIVSLFPNSGSKPEGWVQLGGSSFFAYPLQTRASSIQAAHSAAFQPTP